MAHLNLTGRSPAASGAIASPQKSLPSREQLQAAYQQVFNQLMTQKRELRAKFDAAQTFTANENHWDNADHFDPHTAASLKVRRTLRSRSRYEVMENNPYLKGTLLTIANDFVGSGPKLQIIDKRLSPATRRNIEEKFQEWSEVIKLRHKIWRMRMAKFTDGEAFMIPYDNRNRRFKYPLRLDFHLIETDRVSSDDRATADTNKKVGEIDGVRFDAYENPIAFHVLYKHPGGSALDIFNPAESVNNGKWLDAKFVIQWFRQDRGWLRGIPELTPSLPLCALLRRYTLSVVRHAEIVADFTILLETENPAAPNPMMRDSMGNWIEDPFEVWPVDMGMISNLPYGYKAKQLEAVPLGVQYDAFVGSLLREITRPILAPYNISAGTSKDSNMASGVLDQHIYRGGQHNERFSCQEEVLDHVLWFWWNEALLQSGYIRDRLISSDRSFADQPPKHRWRWDRIGIDHTDPQKAAEALKVLHDKRFLTDADIQESWFNRDVETWREEILEDESFRAELEPINPEDRQPEPEPATSSNDD